MDLELEETVALTISSSSGLGKASAKSLAREGANVVINGRDEDRLAEAESEIEAAGTGDVLALSGDITDPETIETLVETTVDEFGGLDHLVTSAGGPPKLRFPETTDQHWYDAYDLLVMSVVRTVRSASPHLTADGGGSIVTIASRTTKEASPSNVLSSAVRMAVVGLQKTLSKELAPEVRANAVLPGGVETQRIYNGWDNAIERGEIADYEEGRQQRADNIPLSRLGYPEEFGDTVAYLCSPRSMYLNGVAVTFDGGSSSSTF